MTASATAAPSTAAPAAERIPLLDLPAQYRGIQGEIDAAIHDVLARGAFILGPEVRAFEQAFAEYSGARFGIGVGSGTDALFLALRALDLKPGDEVLVPTMTFAATAEAVAYCGATPVFVDVNYGDLQMDPASTEAAVTSRTVGMIPVHLYGMTADVDGALGDVARRHGLWVLEDAAQAHGATTPGGRRAGSVGVMSCFSFYPGKNLGAYGDAGFVATSDPKLAERLRLLRDHGQRGKYDHVLLGYCSRLDNLQAAILGVKLRHLDAWTAARQRAAAIYDELIGDRLERVGRERREGAVQHVYTVRIPDGKRDNVRAIMRESDIEVSVHYPIPVHQIPVPELVPDRPVPSLPVAEQAAREVLSLPIYPELTRAQQERVVAALLEAVAAA